MGSGNTLPWRPGLRRSGLRQAGLGAVALVAVLSGALAGGGLWLAGSPASLGDEAGRNLDTALTAMGLAETASRLAVSATLLEAAATTPRRQAVHSDLTRQAQQLGELLDALLRTGAGAAGTNAFRPEDLRSPAAAVQAGVEDLNQSVERRMAADGNLHAALDQTPIRHTALRNALTSLPADRTRETLDGLGQHLAGQLLLAGTTLPAPSLASAQAMFRETADSLIGTLEALPVDPTSPHRADAARQLAALGLDNGNIYELRQEQARLAAVAGDTAQHLRDRATAIATAARRTARVSGDGVKAEHARARAALAAAPAGIGLLTTLFVFAAGALAARLRGPAAAPAIPPPLGAPQEAPLEAPGASLREASRDKPRETCREAPWSAAGTAGAGPPDDAALEALADEVPPLHVLLAEDEPVNQMAIAALLRRAGHAVTVVGDGRAALAAVEADRYDLVVMDFRMPGMDGVEAVRRIRALPDPVRARVRIVMLTASAVPEDRDRCRTSGADAVLDKPLRLTALRPVLERLFAIETAIQPPSDTDQDTGRLPASDPLRFDGEAIRQMREHLPADRVAALIGNAAATLRRYDESLSEAWTAGDMAGVSTMAHKIAGVAGIYGCAALRAAAQALERAVETGTGDPAEPRRRLEEEAAPALAALEACAAGLVEGTVPG